MKDFYKDKNVLITGHTGFKGSWMCAVLKHFGAKVTGYSLELPTNPALFSILGFDKDKDINNVIGDVRDLEHMRKVFAENCPDIVIHMAAQPLVRDSYLDPVGTYATNVMGTVNVLQCCRETKSVKSIVNVTTDKVYRNNEWDKGYIETDYLDGYDPYSNSKSCSELVTHSFTQSFFSINKVNGDIEDRIVPISTCRAGNVIGGGDFAKDRIIPDCVRAAIEGKDMIVRNPYSIRPYEHVLEPLFVYLRIAMEQYINHDYAGAYNVGPDDESCVTTGDIVNMFVERWNKGMNQELKWINKHDGGPHEATFLKLNCTKLKNTFKWKPVWDISRTLDELVKWYIIYANGGNIIECTRTQIETFMKEM